MSAKTKEVKFVPAYKNRGWLAVSVKTGRIVAWDTSHVLLCRTLRGLGINY